MRRSGCERSDLNENEKISFPADYRRPSNLVTQSSNEMAEMSD